MEGLKKITLDSIYDNVIKKHKFKPTGFKSCYNSSPIQFNRESVLDASIEYFIEYVEAEYQNLPLLEGYNKILIMKYLWSRDLEGKISDLKSNIIYRLPIYNVDELDRFLTLYFSQVR